MELRLVPTADRDVADAVATAVSRAGLEPVDTPDAYASPWRVTALAESVDRESVEAAYVPSPRSTRGATRA
jgi:hypothetical protein